VPLITLGHWLWEGGTEAWDNDSLWPALQQTMLLGALGAVLTVLAAVPLAWLSIRAPSRLQRLQEGCNYITSALPGIVTALALVTITINFARPLYQTVFTILLAYLLMFLPRAWSACAPVLPRPLPSWKMPPAAWAALPARHCGG
jgi:iron(III) transport system permease protein